MDFVDSWKDNLDVWWARRKIVTYTGQHKQAEIETDTNVSSGARSHDSTA
jgi:hypothetical protein